MKLPPLTVEIFGRSYLTKFGYFVVVPIVSALGALFGVLQGIFISWMVGR